MIPVITAYSGDIHDAIDARNTAKVLRILTDNPNAVHDRTLGGSTPLHLAVGINDVKMTRLLIEKGAEVDAATRDGFTPLHWASYMNASDTALILLRNGADQTIMNARNKTPLDLARSEKSDLVIHVLVNPLPDEVAVELEPLKEMQVAEVIKPQIADEIPDKPVLLEPKPVAVVEPPVETQSGADFDALLKTAKTAVKDGDYKTAYTLFTKLVIMEPGREDVNFHYAMTCYKLKDFSRARLGFERVLDINPDNPKAITMLGICNFASGQYEVAEVYLKKALTLNPPESDKVEIEKYLSEVKKGFNRWNYSGRIDAGYFADDNVNVGPDSDIVSIAPIVFGSQTINELVLQDSSKPNDSDGYLLALSLGGGYDMGGKGGWSAFGAASYFENWLESEASAQESMFISANAGLRRITSGDMLQLPLKAASINTGGDELMFLYGISPVYVSLTGPKKNVQLQTAGSVEIRDYNDLNSRDGLFVSIGETVKWVLGTKRHNVSAGIIWSKDTTDVAVYEYIGMSANIGGTYNISDSSSVYGRIKFTNNEYEEKETLAIEPRTDDQIQYLIGVRKAFKRRWGIDINYQSTDNSSTFGLYDYERNVATLSTFLSF